MSMVIENKCFKKNKIKKEKSTHQTLKPQNEKTKH